MHARRGGGSIAVARTPVCKFTSLFCGWGHVLLTLQKLALRLRTHG